MNKVPPLIFLDKGEQTLLASPGLFKERLRSGWKPGHFYLTNRRLVFFSPPRIRFRAQLNDIVALSVEKRAVILRTKEVILLAYRNTIHNRISQLLHPSDESAQNNTLSKAWIAVGDIETWRKRLFERSLLKIDEDGIRRLLEELDSDSQEILSYLWRKKHANIDELASLCPALNHMDILSKIRGAINPSAERLLGCSLLTFEWSKKDDETGKIITYSWWVTGKIQPKDEFEKRTVDIFDEEGYLSMVMELPGVKEEDILFKLENQKITISASSINKKYHEEIDLPAEVDAENFSKAFNNNVLEIKLKKAVKVV